jgi:hypothetical protein
MNAEQGRLIDEVGSPTADLFSGSNAQANVLLVRTLDASQQDAILDAFAESIKHIWIVAVCFAAAALLACLLIKHKQLDKTHVEVKTGLAGEEERRRILMEQRARKREAGTQDPSVSA